jgi:RNA polymerase sigma-70 factor (ECF subfamily)
MDSGYLARNSVEVCNTLTAIERSAVSTSNHSFRDSKTSGESNTPAPFGAGDSATNVSLLLRLSDDTDEGAWSAFVERYAPCIFGWCRRFRIQENDAADVTQDVLIKLIRAMRSDNYDSNRGSFRGWLKSVTGNAVRDMMRSWNRKVNAAGGTSVMLHLAAIQDPVALAELGAQLESQYREELLEEAEVRVRKRLKESTWEVYRLTMSERLEPHEVAERLGIPVGTVYVVRSRVIKHLRQEIKSLSDVDGEPEQSK